MVFPPIHFKKTPLCIRLSLSKMQNERELAEIGQLRSRSRPLLKPASPAIGTGHFEVPLAVEVR
jgi:hypothetical protein